MAQQTMIIIAKNKKKRPDPNPWGNRFCILKNLLSQVTKFKDSVDSPQPHRVVSVIKEPKQHLERGRPDPSSALALLSAKSHVAPHRRLDES